MSENANTQSDLSGSAKNLEKESKRYAMAMELAGGDEAAAKNLLRPEAGEVLAIKCRFYEVNLNIYGISILFYHKEEKGLINALSAVNDDKTTYTISPYMQWEQFRKKIEHMLLYSEVQIDLVKDLEKAIQEQATFGSKEKILGYLEYQNDKDLEEVLEQMLFDAYTSRNFVIELATCDINLVDFHLSERGGKVESPKPKQEESKGKGPKIDGKVISVAPALSPVSGTIITKIQKNDVIFVFIDDESPYAQEYLGKLKQKYDVANPKVPAVVKEIDRSNPKSLVMYVQLQEGLFGKIDETDPVKVMTINSETKQQNEKKTERTSNASMLLGISLVVVITIVIIVIAIAL